MATITREKLADHIAQNIGLAYAESERIVIQFFEQICLAVEKAETVQLSKFGNFTVRHKVARPGRNPKTGEPKEISARTVVTFKPGKTLLQRMPTDVKKR